MEDVHQKLDELNCVPDTYKVFMVNNNDTLTCWVLHNESAWMGRGGVAQTTENRELYGSRDDALRREKRNNRCGE